MGLFETFVDVGNFGSSGAGTFELLVAGVIAYTYSIYRLVYEFNLVLTIHSFFIVLHEGWAERTKLNGVERRDIATECLHNKGRHSISDMSDDSIRKEIWR